VIVVFERGHLKLGVLYHLCGGCQSPLSLMQHETERRRGQTNPGADPAFLHTGAAYFAKLSGLSRAGGATDLVQQGSEATAHRFASSKPTVAACRTSMLAGTAVSEIERPTLPVMTLIVAHSGLYFVRSFGSLVI
jgi:hypothetical protein